LDKFEYKIKAEEMKELIDRGEYEQAAEIADSIDWRRVKSVMMLCIVSDVYKMCRRYEESRDMLLLAYDRHPGGRTIVYSLCELSIKMEDYVQAVEYYKEFAQIAPRDTGKYILQYKLYEAQDVSLEERIAVLEELKKREYREKWAYELAYLYHRVGLETKCVEECDELVLWFGDGKYVIKALELKKLHAPLTAEQQYKYDQRFQSEDSTEEDSVETKSAASEANQEEISVQEEKEDAIQIKTFDAEQDVSINLQEELAADVQEYMGEENEENITRSIVAPMLQTDTIDLSAVQNQVGGDTIDLGAAMKNWQERVRTQREENTEEKKEEVSSEVFFGETGEIESVMQQELSFERMTVGDAKKLEEEIPEKTLEERWLQQIQPPKSMANVLAMEGDGQMSFVLPESEPVERQITGQISLNDIILEWERLKKENEEKRKEDVRQRVLQQTGAMFTEFEASVRDGLLEKLENGETEEVLGEIGTVFKERQETEAAVAEEPVAEEEPETVEEPAAEEEPEAEEEAAVAEEPEAVEEPAAEEEPETVEEPAAEEEPETVEEPAAEEEPEAEEEAAVAEEPEATVEVPKQKPVQEKRKIRNFTKEERELYTPYIQGRSSKEQLIQAIDGISMAAYTGNVIVTGDEGMDSMGLAKNIVREIQMTDRNFSGKIGKISGDTLNSRDIKKLVKDLSNGALIVQKATLMNQTTADCLYKELQQENIGIVVVLEDNKKQMDRFLTNNKKFLNCFTSRVDIEALSDDALVSFGKKYAREKEYSIDTMGLLALHTRIAEMQTSDHAVTVMDVKEIMDEAIESANSKTIGHFFDVLFGKRYDDDDMIILKEKDFI